MSRNKKDEYKKESVKKTKIDNTQLKQFKQTLNKREPYLLEKVVLRKTKR